MSKLDDITYHLYEATSQNPGQYVRAEWSDKPYSPDEARADIKALFLELIGEDINQNGEPHEYADGMNREKEIMRRKVEEL